MSNCGGREGCQATQSRQKYFTERRRRGQGEREVEGGREKRWGKRERVLQRTD